MATANYQQRREQIEDYFDRTAADVWARLTSDEPVSGVRETVRAGRESMRNLLLSWLPQDLTGKQVLDAGCGTGVISIELAKRGAEVIAVDLSQSLIDLANERYSGVDEYHRIQFIVGDMRQVQGERFDHVIAMDSIIHYAARDGIKTLETLAQNVEDSMVFTFAPRTLPLAAMHAVGKFFPRADRAPAIEPISPHSLTQALSNSASLQGCEIGKGHRVSTGFYTSQAMEIARKC